jgi:AraC family transcriptional regulator, arabinose operon regulatory protein
MPIMKPVHPDADYFSRQVTSKRRFFYTDWKSRSLQDGSVLVGGGCEWCAPDFVIDRKRFPFLALEFVWRGRGTVVLKGSRHQVSVGSVFLFDAAVPHHIESDPAAPLVKFFFNFHGPGLRKLLPQLKLTPGELWRVRDPARIAALLEEAIDHALSGSPLSDVAALKTLEHSLTLCALLKTQENETDAAQATFLRCRDYLVRHYPQLASVEEAAEQCEVTASYLTRLFKRFTHETPHHCLLRLKMTQALLLLRQPQVQVKAVAHELGYKSPAHFSRSFAAWHGHPPSAIPKDLPHRKAKD